MHRLRVFHYDIKPDNIMFSPSRGCCVFIDYNLSDMLDVSYGKKVLTMFRGTLDYVSKEMSLILVNKGDR
jgi:serine/threonine protein kinase